MQAFADFLLFFSAVGAVALYWLLTHHLRRDILGLVKPWAIFGLQLLTLVAVAIMCLAGFVFLRDIFRIMI